jgi:hypothetical protein
VVKEPEAKAPIRRMDGLEWLYTRKPPRLTFEQFSIGRRYGEVCAESARVALRAGPGFEAAGLAPDYGPRDHLHAFDAIRAKIAVDRILTETFSPSVGKALIELLEFVCHQGCSIRELAVVQVEAEQKAQGLVEIPAAAVHHRSVVLEERLKMAFTVLRHLVNQREDTVVPLHVAV